MALRTRPKSSQNSPSLAPWVHVGLGRGDLLVSSRPNFFPKQISPFGQDIHHSHLEGRPFGPPSGVARTLAGSSWEGPLSELGSGGFRAPKKVHLCPPKKTHRTVCPRTGYVCRGGCMALQVCRGAQHGPRGCPGSGSGPRGPHGGPSQGQTPGPLRGYSWPPKPPGVICGSSCLLGPEPSPPCWSAPRFTPLLPMETSFIKSQTATPISSYRFVSQKCPPFSQRK